MKKAATVPCANCGEQTHFTNATPHREWLKWCNSCFKQAERIGSLPPMVRGMTPERACQIANEEAGY